MHCHHEKLAVIDGRDYVDGEGVRTTREVVPRHVAQGARAQQTGAVELAVAEQHGGEAVVVPGRPDEPASTEQRGGGRLGAAPGRAVTGVGRDIRRELPRREEQIDLALRHLAEGSRHRLIAWRDPITTILSSKGHLTAENTP